jgi:hypothetical protein
MIRTLTLLALAASLTACQSAQQTVSNKEDLLAAAGFQIQPANSPGRIASMKALPPHKFVRQTKGTSVTYVYADPTVCNCVYFGSQQAWSSYQAMAFQNRVTDEQRMIALASPNAFDFGPWDPVLW